MLYEIVTCKSPNNLCRNFQSPPCFPTTKNAIIAVGCTYIKSMLALKCFTVPLEDAAEDRLKDTARIGHYFVIFSNFVTICCLGYT